LRWKCFQEWCVSNNINPIDVTLQQVADFLNYLFTEKRLSISSIRGYRTALGKVLSYGSGLDLTNCSILTDLISAFARQRPQIHPEFPKWDLHVVLNSMMYPPYEPLSTATLKYVTFKLLFLLLLAFGARRSEIHALDTRFITQRGNWKHVELAPNPKFKSKTFNYETGKENFKGFQIEALKHRLGSGLEEEAKLCPVRALRYYLDRTKERRGEVKQLFISLKGGNKVHRNTISSWTKRIIEEAHRDCPKEVLSSLKVNVHEVRAIATSVAFYGNTAIEDVLKAARWQHQSTFTTFYLRDVAQDLEGVRRFGPFMAAQQIM